MNKYIIISKGPELLRVPTDCLMYVEAQGNYSNVVTQDGKQHLVSLQLGAIEDLIAEQLEETPLVRLGRSLIINTDFIYLIDETRQQLVLSDCRNSYHALKASKEVLSKFKDYMLYQLNRKS